MTKQQTTPDRLHPDQLPDFLFVAVHEGWIDRDDAKAMRRVDKRLRRQKLCLTVQRTIQPTRRKRRTLQVRRKEMKMRSTRLPKASAPASDNA